MKYVVDTSIIISEIISNEINKGVIKGEIIIPKQVIAELEHQANNGQEIGLIGLNEIKKIRRTIKVNFVGDRPTIEQIRLAKEGEIDASIIRIAYKEQATLVTADLVQAKSAEALGVKVLFYDLKKNKIKPLFEEYFDNKTMSVHLKEGVEPIAKKGSPGKITYEKITNKKITKEEIIKIINNINECAHINDDSFIEISRKGSIIAQLGKYRVVITKPPFSEAHEVTIVKPLKETRLSDYSLPENIIKRLDEQASGIIICGPPGAGKSTFAEAIARHYLKKGKIIKTIESPRDLQLSSRVTQYNKALAKQGELHDIILLSRPDYTIFDEVRNISDFKLFADLRLSGVGMIGVTHGATALDTIQRFIGKIELGMIPSIIDTVIFIKEGEVSKVYALNIKVKVPSGMNESDLVRPVIEVIDYLTNTLEYEIYTYGDQTVVIPITKKNKTIREEIINVIPDAIIKKKGKRFIVKTRKPLTNILRSIQDIEKRRKIIIELRRK